MNSHAWLVSHFISLIEYCEEHDLPDVEAALVEAVEKFAPMVARNPGQRQVRTSTSTAKVIAFPAPVVENPDDNQTTPEPANRRRPCSSLA